MDSAGKRKDIPCRVADLNMAKHFHIRSSPIEIQAVAPSFLVLGHHMDIVPEKEGFA